MRNLFRRNIFFVTFLCMVLLLLLVLFDNYETTLQRNREVARIDHLNQEAQLLQFHMEELRRHAGSTKVKLSSNTATYFRSHESYKYLQMQGKRIIPLLVSLIPADGGSGETGSGYVSKYLWIEHLFEDMFPEYFLAMFQLRNANTTGIKAWDDLLRKNGHIGPK